MIDIGAILFITGTFLSVISLFKRGSNISQKLGQLILSMLIIMVGGILMIVDYYIRQGHSSFVTDAIL